jgi:uncharacterized membrane-anchored protein YjiN (DUF445 family)
MAIKAEKIVEQLRLEGKFEDADRYERFAQKLERTGHLPASKKELMVILETVGKVMADHIKDLRKRDDDLRRELRRELRRVAASLSKAQSREIATLLEGSLKEYLRDEVATQVAVSLAKDES